MCEDIRKDTLKFVFDASLPRPQSFVVEAWLEDVVKIETNDVIGIYFSIVANIVYLKLKSTEMCQRIIESSGGTFKFKNTDGLISDVSVMHAGFGIRTVRIFELPFEITAEQINAVVSPYGNIISNVAEKWSSAHKFPVLNGIRQLRVELHKHIPSYIYVCGYRAIVSYDGQPRTCSGCGQPGHVRSQCIQRRVAQLPAGEAERPPTMTTLPLTYSAAATSPRNVTPVRDVIPQVTDTDNAIAMDISNTAVEVQSELQKTVQPIVASDKVQVTLAAVQAEMHETVPSTAAHLKELVTASKQANLVTPVPEQNRKKDMNVSLTEDDNVNKPSSSGNNKQETMVAKQLNRDTDTNVPPTKVDDSGRTSPSTKNKKRKARKGAEELAQSFREKAKRVNTKINETSSGNTDLNVSAVSLMEVETSRPVTLDHATPAIAETKLTQGVDKLPSTLNVHQNWGDEMETDNQEEDMDEDQNPIERPMPTKRKDDESRHQNIPPEQTVGSGYSSDTSSYEE